MDGYEKTPTLGLNKPEKGDFDWDLPLNENWDILDRVGGAQLPLLATIDLDYKLSGDAAIGWALAGSTLSGNTYTSLWTAMKAAYDRSVAANETHYNKTYSVGTDAVTGWRFVTMDVYNRALSALGDSLGHVLDTSAKTIILRASWFTYDLPTQDTRYIGYIWDETLPNSKGEFYVSNVAQDFNGQQAGASTLNPFAMDVFSYKDTARVCPQSKNLLRYYKVGNTITNVENIDVGNVLKELQALSVNSANVSLSNVSSDAKQTAVNWNKPNYKAGVAMTSPYTTPKAGFIIGVHNLSDNVFRSLTINSVEIYNTKSGAAYLGGQTAGFCYPVAKGDIVSWTYFNKMTFYPNKGV